MSAEGVQSEGRVVIQVVVDPGFVAQVDAIAAAEHRSRSGQVRAWIAEGIERAQRRAVRDLPGQMTLI